MTAHERTGVVDAVLEHGPWVLLGAVSFALVAGGYWRFALLLVFGFIFGGVSALAYVERHPERREDGRG